jgi:hypothetical protein
MRDLNKLIKLSDRKHVRNLVSCLDRLTFKWLSKMEAIWKYKFLTQAAVV